MKSVLYDFEFYIRVKYFFSKYDLPHYKILRKKHELLHYHPKLVILREDGSQELQVTKCHHV
jgi:hypothetical protein